MVWDGLMIGLIVELGIRNYELRALKLDRRKHERRAPKLQITGTEIAN